MTVLVCIFGSGKSQSGSMVRTGRPTQDPKEERITVRLAPRDRQALQALADKEQISIAEAARRVMRGALGISELPLKKSPRIRRRKS